VFSHSELGSKIFNAPKAHKHKKLTEKIINIFYRVYNKLGYGFLEKIYENAMMIEFKREGILSVSQSPINVFYEGEVIGEYYADILVDNKAIVEVKAAKRLVEENDFLPTMRARKARRAGLRVSAETCPPSGRRVCVLIK